jgi:isoleucyl-tRNA synthetase
MEGVWSLLKAMWDRDLLYKGYKVVPYCPRCGSPLSSHELSQGYKDDVKDPSVYPMFELEDEPGTYFLAWTTTPWTLPGNVALAVGPEIQYVKVRVAPDAEGRERRLILAEARLSVLDGEVEILERLGARDLVGKTYRPLYTYLLPKEPAFFVVEADFVSVEDGTGVVHTAAAYGEDDLRLCQEKGVPVRHVVDLRGQFMPEVERFAGMFVKDADVPIMVDLAQRGLLYKKGTVRHTYPFCWRCDTPLLYYAMDSWFIRTSAHRDALVANNRGIKWVPEHIRDGRMGNWLEGAVDWSLSRYRYWATPLPVWECESCDRRVCVGSAAELGLPPDADLHRPKIDEVTIPCPAGDGLMRRVPDLIDVWFDSGAMPYAQYHWPFPDAAANAAATGAGAPATAPAGDPPLFPADFICEAIDQTRGWFYSLLAISTLVSGRSSYRNVVCLSHVVDAEGKKMSKSKGNVVDPIEMMDAYGADALRWYFYTAVSAGTEYRVAPRMFEEVVRRFLLILWNTYSFFVTYANLDGYVPGERPRIPVAERPLLDRWVLAELAGLTERVTKELEDFDATSAGRAIEAFVIDLSTWYVRRSRRRFWKSDSDADKLSAYQTLHECLLAVARLLAPFTPFVAEELHGNLSRGVEGARDSVHLEDWPEPDETARDPELLAAMRHARRIVERGHRERDVHQVKVRQPLRSADVPALGGAPAGQGGLTPLPPELEAVVRDELNLKTLVYHSPDDGEVRLDLEIDRELRLEGLARDLVRRVQETRKQAELNIDDRIELWWRAEGELAEAFAAWGERIAEETLARRLAPAGGDLPEGLFERDLRVEGQPLWLGLRAAG